MGNPINLVQSTNFAQSNNPEPQVPYKFCSINKSCSIIRSVTEEYYFIKLYNPINLAQSTNLVQSNNSEPQVLHKFCSIKKSCSIIQSSTEGGTRTCLTASMNLKFTRYCQSE